MGEKIFSPTQIEQRRVGNMFGTYEDNVMIYRRKIAQASELPIMTEKRNTRSTDVERVNVDRDEQYKIKEGKVDKPDK